MNTVKVYHNAFGDDFKLVAEWETELAGKECINYAYQITNTIEEPWYDNGAILVHLDPKLKGIRSTSVGDFIKLEENGVVEWYEVANFGFEKRELSDIIEYCRYVLEERVWYKKPLGYLVAGADLGV